MSNVTTRFKQATAARRGERKLAVLPDCQAKERVEQWRGTLLGDKSIGCAINSLAFLSELDTNMAIQKVRQLGQCATRMGTPFSDVVDWFNKRQDPEQPLLFQEARFKLTDGKPVPNQTPPATSGRLVPETDPNTSGGMHALFGFYAAMESELPNDACTVVKMNRPEGTTDLTPGHTVVIAKNKEGQLATIDPQQLTVTPFKGRVSAAFYNAFVAQRYISASVAIATDPTCQDLVMSLLTLSDLPEEETKERTELTTHVFNMARFMHDWKNAEAQQQGGRTGAKSKRTRAKSKRTRAKYKSSPNHRSTRNSRQRF
jgi:hypothetical protein